MYNHIYIYPQVLNGTKLALPRFSNGSKLTYLPDPSAFLANCRPLFHHPQWIGAGKIDRKLPVVMADGIPWYPSDYSWKESVDGNKILRGAHQQK